MIHLKDEVFDELIQEGTVVVDFYADWCGPCRMLGPILEEISEERSDIKIIKVNTEEHEELAMKYGVMSIPNLKLFQDGKLIDSRIGFLTKDALEDWIQKR